MKKIEACLKELYPDAAASGITETDMMKAVPKEVTDSLVRQIPLCRSRKPEDTANEFVFLVSEKASYITGMILNVDGMARLQKIKK